MSIMEAILQTIPKPKPKPTTKPIKWWHWILMYPTLIIFVFGNVPTLHQLYLSINYDVPFTKAYDAKRQDNYWERNFQDLENQKFENTMVRKDGLILDYRIFDSGDILIWAGKEGELGSTRWIGFENLVPSSFASIFAINEAIADGWQEELSPIGARKQIICRQRLRGGRILVRVRYDSGSCYDEVIETGSGRVLSRNPAPCNRSCN